MDSDYDEVLAALDVLARDCRDRAEAETLLVEIVLPDDERPASEALRAYLRDRVGVWRYAARGLELTIARVTAEPGAIVGLASTLGVLLRGLSDRRVRGPEAVRAVVDTLAPPLTMHHARVLRLNAEGAREWLRACMEAEEERRRDAWRGDVWPSDDAWRSDDPTP